MLRALFLIFAGVISCAAQPCGTTPLAFADDYVGNLASSYTSGGSSLSVVSGTGLPSGATCFYLTVKAEGANTKETFLCTNRSGTTLTCSGAQAGTAASNHASGATVLASIMTSGAFAQLKTDAAALANPTPSSSGTTYYISTSGNDSNPCSSGSKCLTLAHVISLLPTMLTKPYTINVADGTYTEAIAFNGFLGTVQGYVKIVGNTGTPGNVVFNGSTTCVVSDGAAGYTSTLCNTSQAVLNVSGVTLTAGSGIGRAIFTMDGGHTIISNVTANCPSMADSNLPCIEIALSSTLEIISPVTINLTGNTASGVGIEVNQGSEVIYYGDSGNHALTIAGPNANADTLVGIQVHRRGLFDIHLLGSNQTSTISITGVNLGVLVVAGTWQQHNTGSANPQITISHSSGTSGTAVYVEAGFWFGNVGGIQLTNLSTGFQADSAGNIVQKNCAYTNVSTHSNIASGSGFACF